MYFGIDNAQFGLEREPWAKESGACAVKESARCLQTIGRWMPEKCIRGNKNEKGWKRGILQLLRCHYAARGIQFESAHESWLNIYARGILYIEWPSACDWLIMHGSNGPRPIFILWTSCVIRLQMRWRPCCLSREASGMQAMAHWALLMPHKGITVTKE
jgi:hypothetical protein